MPNTDMKQAALSSLYGIGNAGTGYQNDMYPESWTHIYMN